MRIKKLWAVGLIFLLASCGKKVDNDSINTTINRPTPSETESNNANFFTSDVSLEATNGEKKMEITKTAIYNVGNYYTGNYINVYKGPTYKIDGADFEYYRALRKADEIVTLIPHYEGLDDGTLKGAFYNTNRIENISRVVIEYNNESTSVKTGFSFACSNDNLSFTYQNAPSTTESTLIQANCSDSAYFRIEAVEQMVTVSKIYVFYKGEVKDRDVYSSGRNLYRLNPTVYTGELVDGKSSVDVPVEVKVNPNGTYEITKTKTLTYYSNDYVLAHPKLVSTASYTEPYEVAAYTIAFKVRPANYFYTTEMSSTVYDTFGKKLRTYSEYKRTDGYVNAIPYNPEGLRYSELDINIGNTYVSDAGSIRRGVGRVVVFMNGFKQEDYDNNAVAVFTDDHYATFQEYLNTGSFSNRFAVQSIRTGFNYGPAVTLNK